MSIIFYSSRLNMDSILQIILKMQVNLTSMQKALNELSKQLESHTVNHIEANKQHLQKLIKHASFLAQSSCHWTATKAQELLELTHNIKL